VAMDLARVERLMAFTHGMPCPYKVGNHRVLICIWDVGTRRAESGVLSGGDGLGACGAFDGVHTRHAVSVQVEGDCRVTGRWA